MTGRNRNEDDMGNETNATIDEIMSEILSYGVGCWSHGDTDTVKTRRRLRATISKALDSQAQQIAAMTAERDELRKRLAEIDEQEPILWAPSCASHEFASGVRGYGQQLTVWFDRPSVGHLGRGHCQTPLYARPAPATDASGCEVNVTPAPGEWIEWHGGECPIEDDRVSFEFKFRDGIPHVCGPFHHAYRWRWSSLGISGDIVAYRILP